VAQQLGYNPASPPAEVVIDPVTRRDHLLAVHLLRQEAGALVPEAVRLLEGVTARGVAYAPAWAALAEALARSNRVADAWVALGRAVALDPTLAETQRVRAHLELTRWRLDSAVAAIDRAVAASPGDAFHRHTRAYVLILAGRFDEAFREMDYARGLDPVSAAVHADLGSFHYAAGRWSDGLAQCAVAARFASPAHASQVDRCRLIGQVGAGRADSARRIAERLLARSPSGATVERVTESAVADRAFWEAVAGDTVRLALVFGGAGPYARARALAIGGDQGRALAALEDAAAARTPALIRIGIEPEFAALRSNPRFARISEIVGVPVSLRALEALAAPTLSGGLGGGDAPEP
jgi:tetratricopeptide (TPR) repeat protein